MLHVFPKHDGQSGNTSTAWICNEMFLDEFYVPLSQIFDRKTGQKLLEHENLGMDGGLLGQIPGGFHARMIIHNVHEHSCELPANWSCMC